MSATLRFEAETIFKRNACWPGTRAMSSAGGADGCGFNDTIKLGLVGTLGSDDEGPGAEYGFEDVDR